MLSQNVDCKKLATKDKEQAYNQVGRVFAGRIHRAHGQGEVSGPV